MHSEAYQWVQKYAWTPDGRECAVLDIGGRDINGSVRELFPSAKPYVSIDLEPGPGVDIVANAATWVPDRTFDIVLAVEVFEHTWQWPEICLTAYWALTLGGRFIATMAGPGRHPHSGHDGEFRLLPGEYYGNVDPADLRRVLTEVGFTGIEVDQSGLDVRAVAVKPGWVRQTAVRGGHYTFEGAA